MNFAFSVALDSVPQERNFMVAAGDDFTLTVSVFATDTAEDIDPVELTGKTLKFEIFDYPMGDFSAEGNVFTFEAPAPRKCYYGLRTPYRIVMVDEAGNRSTLCQGYRVINAPAGFLWGGSGSDYGWRL
jgi:hypothetical protein